MRRSGPHRRLRASLRSRHATLEAAREAGQTALALVLGLVLLLVTVGVALANNAVQHDPLVQTDVLQHDAYRALEAGINTMLSTINAHPNVVNCSTASRDATCSYATFDHWTQVPHTTVTPTTGKSPEYYLWTNPQLCFSATRSLDTSCTSSQSSGNFEFVQELIEGAAGVAPHFAYQSAVAHFVAENGFLTHVWWSDYEATDPALAGASQTACTYDWTSSAHHSAYSGPGSSCSPVYFGPGDIVDGPVYSNDSIYITSTPLFGRATTYTPVDTHDPKCLFVGQPGSSGGSFPGCKTMTRHVKGYTSVNSHYDLPLEPIPSTDTEIEKVASLYGCAYSGPTTISFYTTTTADVGYMNVTSPETPIVTGHDADNASSNTTPCVGRGLKLPVSSNFPTDVGAIYVATSTWGNNGQGTCSGNGDNPFDGIRQSKLTTAQILAPGYRTGTRQGYNFTDDIDNGVNADCQGDAFVRDATTHVPATTPGGHSYAPGISGRLTVAAGNNVVITGNLEYSKKDCGTTFTGTGAALCRYNPGGAGVNDALGLVANNYVEVNHPVKPDCVEYTSQHYVWTPKTGKYVKTSTTSWTCNRTPLYVLTSCPAKVSSLTAVLCNPGPTLTVDAAILALGHSFAVDNWTFNQRSTGSSSPTGKLYVYGAIDQKWRGAVGSFSYTRLYSGYQKDYTWDSRLQYVSLPAFLTPGTPSWLLGSTSTVMSATCSRLPKPFPTGFPYVQSRTSSSAYSATGTTPAGASC